MIFRRKYLWQFGILIVILLLSVGLFTKLFDLYLSHECLGLVLKKAQAIDSYIHKLNFEIDFEKSRRLSGDSEKYILTADDGSKWIFKVDPFAELRINEIFFYRLFEYLGVPVPWGASFHIVINGTKKRGILAQYVLASHSDLRLEYYDEFPDLSSKQLTSIIKGALLSWMLWGEALADVESILGEDGEIYTIDLDNQIRIPIKDLEDLRDWTLRCGTSAFFGIDGDERSITKKKDEIYLWKKLFKEGKVKDAKNPDAAISLLIEVFQYYLRAVFDKKPLETISQQPFYKELLPYLKAFNEFYSEKFLPWEEDRKTMWSNVFFKYEGKIKNQQIKAMVFNAIMMDRIFLERLADETGTDPQISNFIKRRLSRSLYFFNYSLPQIFSSEKLRCFDTNIMYKLNVRKNLLKSLSKINKLNINGDARRRTEFPEFNIVASGQAFYYLKHEFSRTMDDKKTVLTLKLGEMRRAAEHKNEKKAIDLYLKQVEANALDVSLVIFEE